MNNTQKRKQFIRKLFVQVSKDSFCKSSSMPVKLLISEHGEGNCCGYRLDFKNRRYIQIAINLTVVDERAIIGFSANYYDDRPKLLNKYIINNKHNTIRFILYHEARHAYQRLNNIRNSMSREIAEKDADEWALAHIRKEAKK